MIFEISETITSSNYSKNKTACITSVKAGTLIPPNDAAGLQQSVLSGISCLHTAIFCEAVVSPLLSDAE